jgi:hypothetical protein
MKPVFLQERVSVLAWRAVPLGLNQQVENFTLCIDSAPQIDRKRDVTTAGHYAAIGCEPGPLHFQGSSSSIFVFG